MPTEPPTRPGADRDLHAVLTQQWDRAGDRPFLESPDGTAWSFAQTSARADAFASALQALGVELGDRVVVHADKSPDAVALYLGCLRIGAVYVPLNPSSPAAEVAFFVSDAEPAVVVTAPGADPGDLADVGGGGRGPALLSLGVDGDGTLAALADGAGPSIPVAAPRGDDLAAMLYTSGTTGRSKGAMLTHRGLAANGRALHDIWGFRADDVLVHALPIFHVHGLFVALHCAMLATATVRFLPRFSVDGVLAALDGATVMMGVPTHYTRLLDDERFDRERCASMRLFTSGSAPMTEAVHERFTARTGHRILERYGMTEAGIITSNPLDGARIPGTVGFALPGMEVRVATDDGPCAPGENGVVEVRGPHLFAGYWRLPERTAAEMRPDGFFVTGDVGHLDTEGRLTLEGRAGDMIISGGENVYPKEIELRLDELPDVVESAVVGLPHPDLGEAVTAFVVTRPGVADALDREAVSAALGRHLSRFKHPRDYIVMDSLPRNAMGKVQKHALRAAHTAHYDR